LIAFRLEYEELAAGTGRMHLRLLSVLIISSVPLARCTYDDGPDPRKQFMKLDMDAP
jgi:hypothetical protein